MSITIVYEPDVGITCLGISIPWGTHRKIVREKLESPFVVQDLELGDMIMHRDIYRELAGQPVSIFLNYDKDFLLSELEVHNGVEFVIKERILTFESEFAEILECLNEISFVKKMVDEGEVVFFDLKLNLYTGARSGGEDDDTRLSYIYCSKSFDHMID